MQPRASSLPFQVVRHKHDEELGARLPGFQASRIFRKTPQLPVKHNPRSRSFAIIAQSDGRASVVPETVHYRDELNRGGHCGTRGATILPMPSYSTRAAYSRCASVIEVPSSAARNAARSAAFRM